MTTEVWRQIREVFHAVVELRAEERSAYLDQTCPDLTLRKEVESLLRFHEEAGSLMEEPALKISADPAKKPEQDPWLGNYIGQYQIIDRIGQGGMGTVYRAIRIDEQYLKQVAIKLIRPGFASDHYLRRFKNERQIMASLDHRNIARLLDGGTTKDGLPYFVMEYIEGKRLDEYCDAHNLSTKERLKLFLEMCSAVQYAHSRLVVHRDLKPGNVLVTEEGTPKLLDFGVAKLMEPELFLQTTALTATMMRPMTPEFASPEQIQGEAITTSSDVYSLGVLLYRLLTGHAPYRLEGRPLHELARTVSETEPVKPSLVIEQIEEETGIDGQTIKLTPESVSRTREGRPEVLRQRLEGDLDNIILKALRKEPVRRYSSVEQLADDIRRHMDGLPILARKDTFVYRTTKFVKRHRIGVAATALIALTLVGGIITTAWQARIARAERAKAVQRFNDVRQIANALIFDVDDAIASLPGSTPARKLLVENALKYLDTLAKESKGDLGLERELAGAYDKLGDVQGNPFRPNLGDTAAAIESYRKVLQMRQAIAAANPGNKDDEFALGVAYRRMGQMMVLSGNLQNGLVYTMKARASIDPLVASDPKKFEFVDELQNVYELIGDIQGGNGLSANLGDTAAALENHRKALALAEGLLRDRQEDPHARRGVAIYYIKVADDLVKQGNRATAQENYQKALKIYKSLAAGSVSTIYTREINLVYTRMGDAQLMDGDGRSALQNYRLAMDLAEQLVAADPQNALARQDLGTGYAMLGKAAAESGNLKDGLFYMNKAVGIIEVEVAHDPKQSDSRRILGLLYVWRGQLLGQSGNIDAALTDYKKTVELLRTITTADPGDVEARMTLAATNAEIAELLGKKGNIEGAHKIYQDVLAVAEPFAHSVPANPQAQYTVADAYSELGDLSLRQASKAPHPSERMKHWTQAKTWYEKSRAEWKQVSAPGKMSPSGFDTAGPGLVAERLNRCNAELDKLKQN